jgi:stearoyl-CoA desaturase (delta-9 desaturase)
VSALVITGLARVGLAHDVVTITPERQAQKQLQPDGKKTLARV